MGSWLTQIIENEGVEGVDAQGSVIYPIRLYCNSNTLRIAWTDSQQHQPIDSYGNFVLVAEVRHPLHAVLDTGLPR